MGRQEKPPSPPYDEAVRRQYEHNIALAQVSYETELRELTGRPEPPSPRPAPHPPSYTLLYGAGDARPLHLWHCVAWVFIAIDVTWTVVVLIWIVQHFAAR